MRYIHLSLVTALSGSVLFLSSATTTIRTPVNSFDIANMVPTTFRVRNLHVQGFRVRLDRLYFCISGGPVPRPAAILTAQANGSLQGFLLPPADKEVADFDVDGRGIVHVLLEDGPHTTILTYGRNGQLRSSISLPTFASQLTLARGRQITLVPDRSAPHLEVVDADGTQQIPVSVPAHSMIDALPDGRVMVAERGSGMIHIVDPVSRHLSSFTAGTPATVGGQPSSNRAPTLFAAFSHATSSPDGDIYVIAGTYKMADGAPVSHFDSQGKLIEAIRCYLPTFDAARNPDNAEGYMLANMVGVGQNVLVLVSPAGHVATYTR